MLRPVYTKCQWFSWSFSVNVWVISDQLGSEPIFGAIHLVYDEILSNFDFSEITSDIATLMLTLQCKRIFTKSPSSIRERTGQ